MIVLEILGIWPLLAVLALAALSDLAALIRRGS